ncbi:MAG TPA: hypothetical protein VMW91_01090 [Desulfosporosinus sp.]|nr:hypothetical protein [Desulfosporosinus sp.]
MQRTLLKVGEARKFKIRDEKMIIQEIMHDTDITMDWTWFICECPHCRKRIEETKNHGFRRVEILVKEGTTPEEATIRDALVFGIDGDGKFMLFTSEKCQEAYSKSEKFKHLTEV